LGNRKKFVGYCASCDEGNNGVVNARSVVEVSPDVMSGNPVFAGTRVPIQTLFDYLKGGDSLNDFLDDFPTVTRGQAVLLLEMAGADLIDAAVTGRITAQET